MKQFSKELGKVSITPKGDWDSSITNERLDIVYDRRNNQAYIAKQDVPIGVDIDNREYWQPLNVSGYADNNFINLTAENENGTITAYESLEEAVATILPINRRPGATLSFYNLNSDRLDRQAEFELWQFNSTDLANWENRDYWNNIYYNWNVFAGWYVGADALKNHVSLQDSKNQSLINDLRKDVNKLILQTKNLSFIIILLFLQCQYHMEINTYR